jgi:hypothetical protein
MNKINKQKPGQKMGQTIIPKTYPIKIYFPMISRDMLEKILNTKSTATELSKYLVNENVKITIYGSTGIYDVVDDNLYQMYPIDKPVKEMKVGNMKRGNDNKHVPAIPATPTISVLVDSSYMKRFAIPSFQIPYSHYIEKKTIMTYRLTPKSNTRFIIELKDNKIHDFYIQTAISDLNIIEINTFLQEDIISFLSLVNLYR